MFTARSIRILLFLVIAMPCAVARAGEPVRKLREPTLADAVEVHRERGDALEEAKRAAVPAGELWFRNGRRLVPEPGLDPSLDEPSGTLLLQFPAAIQAAWRTDLEKLGVEIHDYVQSHAFLVTVPAGAADAIRERLADGRIRWAGSFPPEAKLDWRLPVRSSREIPVTVLLVPGAGEDAAASLEAWMTVESEGREGTRFVRGKTHPDRLLEIARQDLVTWIEPTVEGRLHNIEAAMNIGADDVLESGNFTGDGVRAAVVDTGITRTGSAAECGNTGAAYHPDLPSGRIDDEWDFHNSDANACDDRSHGTHTAGTLGGAGVDTDDWMGIAPDVTLLIYKDCCNSEGGGFYHFASVLGRAADHDADLVANSWGGGHGVCDANCLDADRAVLGNWTGSDDQPQRMFLSFSAGNERDEISSPGTAKNVVAVGALSDGNWPDDGPWCYPVYNCDSGLLCGCNPRPWCEQHYTPGGRLACFSNTGPVDTDGDGHARIKPDLVAPGTRITSTAASHLVPGGDLYVEMDGTSMAQPVVAGAAAMLIEAYPFVRNWPEATKVKLLATANDLQAPAGTGHGMVDALHAIYDTDYQTTLVWSVGEITGTGQEQDLWFSTAWDFHEIRVFLTWSDPASSTTETVNDLDLRVYDHNGTLVGSSLHHDDTVEVVRARSGAPGNWRINVRGYNVPQPNARYAVAAVHVHQPPALSVDAQPTSVCRGPGQSFGIAETLYNAAAPAPLSEMALDLPDDPALFALSGVNMETDQPGRDHYFLESEIHHDPGPNHYILYTGEVSGTVPRRVSWDVEVNPATPDGDYLLLVYGSAFGTITYGNTVDVHVDGVPPSGVVGLDSPTHDERDCSSVSLVQTMWEAGGDAGCGVDGYAVTWSQGAAQMPPPVKMIEEDSSFFWEVLGSSPAPYFFNIRSVDNAGNWQPSYESWGPLWIDDIPPDIVVNLGSESHPAHACTENPWVEMLWQHAPDNACGTVGYSVGWSANLPAMPDAVQDLGMETSYASGVTPSNEPRYFNIRAVDMAGNWATWAASHGPVWVDQVPGELEGFSLSPAYPHLDFSWVAKPLGDYYRVYADTDPRFPSPVQLNDDVTSPFLHHVDGMTGAERIVYYRVVGTNICGLEGP